MRACLCVCACVRVRAWLRACMRACVFTPTQRKFCFASLPATTSFALSCLKPVLFLPCLHVLLHVYVHIYLSFPSASRSLTKRWARSWSLSHKSNTPQKPKCRRPGVSMRAYAPTWTAGSCAYACRGGRVSVARTTWTSARPSRVGTGAGAATPRGRSPVPVARPGLARSVDHYPSVLRFL